MHHTSASKAPPRQCGYPESIQEATDHMQNQCRIGHGWDLHLLAPTGPDGEGRPLRLGGVLIEHSKGPVAHSDGDALLHAVTDALLGAIGAPDIGQLFPDKDPTNENTDSAVFLAEACRRMTHAQWRISNLDATVICQRPRLGPYVESIKAQLATLLDCTVDQVNIKCKTHEGVDAVGEERAIEVHVVALLCRC